MINELSIIIPAYNEEKYLPKLLTSISIQTYTGKLQVIVVNGNSQDKTEDAANSFKSLIKDIEVISTKKGIGIQRNEGVKKAKYKYILFIDADMILPKYFLSKFLKKINDTDAVIASSMLWPADGNFYEWLLLASFYPCIWLLVLINPSTPGGLTFISKKLHNRIHGFNEELLLAEDLDYSNRAVRTGAKYHMFFTPVAYHSVRRLRKMGALRFFIFWLKYYIFHITKGFLYKKERFSYPYGNY